MAEQTTDKDTTRKFVWTLVAGFGLLIAGYAIALWGIHGLWDGISQPKLASGLNPFALLFVMAMAIERIIQPFAPFLGPDSAVPKQQLAATKAEPAPDATKVAADQTAVTQARNNTAIVTWGAACGLAFILASGINATLLRTLIDSSAGSRSVAPFWLDLLLTGLIVGAGTKPLNDLWTRLQQKSATA